MKPPAKEASIPSLVLKKIIPAKRSDVFDAWTKPEVMREWFKPAAAWQSECAIDPRVGGRWSNEMTDVHGAGKPNGEKTAPGTCRMHAGEFLEFKRPERIVFTWNTDFVKNTRVTVELKDLGETTELTLTHELLPTPELRDGHNEGWTICLANLTALLSR